MFAGEANAPLTRKYWEPHRVPTPANSVKRIPALMKSDLSSDQIRTVLTAWLSCLVLSAPALAQTQPASGRAWPDVAHQRLAAYDAELRLGNGRVDIDGTLARLRQLGATTYYWFIGAAATDWDDLQLFLPKAADAGIEVWAYILPPQESPPSQVGSTFSEPYRLDFPRWAQEIARLSLRHPNLTAWVIDDFYLDHAFFTPAYVRSLQSKAKAINPHLAFVPIMYPTEVLRKNVEPYRDTLDGVIVAYLLDRADIERARSVLNGDGPTPGEIRFPDDTASHAGDYAMISQSAAVDAGKPAVVRFRERDNYTGPTAGYHMKQLLVDGHVVWEKDVAGGDADWHDLSVDISGQVQGKTKVTLAFRMLDKQPVGNFGVVWRLADLHADGLRLDADLSQVQKWQVAVQGDFEAGFGPAPAASQEHRRLPMISMVAAQKLEFQGRHGAPATADRIAQMLRVSLQAWQAGQCDGVVTYRLDLGPQSDVFRPVEKLFREFGNAEPNSSR